MNGAEPLIALVLLALIFLVWPANDDPAIRGREKRERREDMKRLMRDGYCVDEEGLVQCVWCKSDCGQCSGAPQRGTPFETYKKLNWR